MATSTITEPFFIATRSCRVTSRGALAPGISTAPTTRSACRICSRTVWASLYSVCTFAGITSSRYRSRSRFTSISMTFAPSPAATFAALVPTTPAPRITTCAGETPGTPPSRIPRPIIGFSRYFAPSWMLIFPAISLIGVRSGSVPFLSLIVSYAIATIPLSRQACVNSFDAAK